jgi:hypothetical protein
MVMSWCVFDGWFPNCPTANGGCRLSLDRIAVVGSIIMCLAIGDSGGCLMLQNEGAREARRARAVVYIDLKTAIGSHLVSSYTSNPAVVSRKEHAHTVSPWNVDKCLMLNVATEPCRRVG